MALGEIDDEILDLQWPGVAGKMFELASKATIEGWKPVQDRAREALGELQKAMPERSE